jgi:YgiT-type zinc finger domain-containing protein
MWSEEIDRRWMRLANEVFIGMREWRLVHPRATLTEMEVALDERWASVRARLLEDVALASAAADLSTAPPTERAACPACGHVLHAHGQEERRLTTLGDQTLTLARTRAVCPACGTGVFPPG